MSETSFYGTGRRKTSTARVFLTPGNGDITVDIGRCEVSRRGAKIDLTPVEFKLLRVFLANRGRVLTIDDLLREVWGADAVLTDRVVYTHVNHLRNKLEPNPSEPRFLVGVRGVGYRFDA